MNVHKAEVSCRYDEITHSKCTQISRKILFPEMCKMTKRMLLEVNISFSSTAIHEVSKVPSMTCRVSKNSFHYLLQFYNFQISFNDLESVTSSRRKTYLEHVAFYSE
jgi:hypothetical protein